MTDAQSVSLKWEPVPEIAAHTISQGHKARSWAAPRTAANLLLIQCIMIIMSGPKDASVPWHRGAIVAAMNRALDGPDQLIGTEWGSGMEQGTAEPEPRLRLKTCTWRTRPACRYESAGGIRATGKEEEELVKEERKETLWYTYYNTQEDTLSITLIDTISKCYFWNLLLQSGSFMMLVTPSRERTFPRYSKSRKPSYRSVLPRRHAAQATSKAKVTIQYTITIPHIITIFHNSTRFGNPNGKGLKIRMLIWFKRYNKECFGDVRTMSFV